MFATARPNRVDRRVFVLLFCALAGLAVLVVRVPTSTPSTISGPAGHDVARVVLPSIKIDVGQPLAGLWSTDLTQRFPLMKDVAASRFSVLPDHQIVSYYGNPYTDSMGILGSADLETIADELEQQAARYDALNGPLGAIPAIHLVYAVAQPHPTNNGLYLQYVDDATVQRYIDLTASRGMLLFLDLQIGRSTVEHEVSKVVKYLRYPNVHLALDPEFAMTGAHVPGEAIGSITANDVNATEAVLQDVVVENNLPPKMLIVHQFRDDMVQEGDAIHHEDGVDLIIDADGYGSSAVKRATYAEYASRSYAAHAAIKLFLQYDDDLMSEQDVLRLQPTPAIVIYQ